MIRERQNRRNEFGTFFHLPLTHKCNVMVSVVNKVCSNSILREESSLANDLFGGVLELNKLLEDEMKPQRAMLEARQGEML